MEVLPVPIPDEADAGSVWRDEKLRDFVFRMRCLGLDGDPAFVALANQIAEVSQSLEELAEKQRSPGYQRPWWHDGEYDSARADSANDRGMQLFSAGKFSAAFDCYTEAVRLCPTSPVYHANQAAAALRLGRPELAASAAEAAVQRDPAYLKAHLRLGRARLLLGQPAEAEAAFRRALELHAGNATASKGLREAAAAAQQQQEEQEEEQAAAAAGSRAGMPRGAIPEEEAAARLYAAEQMLAANPRLQAARCARVEALLQCQRYAEAEAACEGLLEGTPDRLYLEAEVAWRRGRLVPAIELLQQALAALGESGQSSSSSDGSSQEDSQMNGGSSSGSSAQASSSDCGSSRRARSCAAGIAKCSSLLGYLQPLAGLEEEALAALEEGKPQQCIDACTALLAGIEAPTACVGLACSALHRRAEAHAARRAWEAAVGDLDAALALDAGHAPSLQARAEAHKQMGSYTACFLDLQRLRKAAPGTPGLFELLEEAARLSLSGGGGGNANGEGGWGAAAREAGGSAVEAALRTLGIAGSATSAQARQAYLKLAARWHPDKWMAGSAEEQAAAGERFKELQAAYALLTG